MNITLIPTPHADEYLQSQFDILAAPAFSPLWNAKLLTAAAAVLHDGEKEDKREKDGRHETLVKKAGQYNF